MLLLAEHAAQHGVDPEQLLASESLTIERAMEFGAEFEEDLFNRLIGRAANLASVPEFRYQLSRRLSLIRFSLINDIVVSAQTLRDAFEICCGLSAFHNPPIRIRKEETTRRVKLVFEPQPGREMDSHSLAIIMSEFVSLACLLTGRDLEGTARLALPPLQVYEHIARHFGTTIEFDSSENCLEFKPELLDYALLPAQREAGLEARRKIRAELKVLKNEESFGDMIRNLVFDESRGIYSMEEIAAKLGFSARTLQRHLSDVDLVFSDIVEDIRLTKSQEFLLEGKYSVGRVADLLGYTDVSNFSRAFRRWTGKSPREFQRCEASEG